MKFIFGKNDLKNFERGQENCYLITNGLGGFSSMTIIGSNARSDHAMFMACTKAPNNRFHLITKLNETIEIQDKKYDLSSQEYVTYTKNRKGHTLLNAFKFDVCPVWIYQAGGVEVQKTIVMKHGENTLGVQYMVRNHTDKEVEFKITPYMQFVNKGMRLNVKQIFETGNEQIKSNGITLFYNTNGSLELYQTQYEEELYYAYDARDGRDAIGCAAHNHRLCFTISSHEEKECYVVYSLKNGEESVNNMIVAEKKRQQRLIEQSGMVDEIGKQLVKSADMFIVERESTNGKSIIAGYPFFGDWGRDTMIAMIGCCISTKRYEDAKNIFRTFIKYCRKGIMPNTFPEGDNNPFYNTADASLLFIGAVYEYYLYTKDEEFVQEAYSIMEDIISWYKRGTDFHIHMDTDGLITAGANLEQVTWMDVRFGDILPTPRHGKPVEINAYWYNDLKIMEFFSELLGKMTAEYGNLAKKVLTSFQKKFWNNDKGCLRDVLSGTVADEQIRCNQIWAVSVPFGMLTREQEKQVVDTVFEKLYTPYGLRSLSMEDKKFKPKYGGSHFERDMAYHQGTVWAFPLGGYYLAYLKVHDYSKEAADTVRGQLEVMEACLREGCVGQIAEIYDGENPTISQGCYAQAWSVSEILRVYNKLQISC
ncbi:amylo-alpha-1,6-glucosidase [Clostridium oryzae]|uniref:Amylo-alpha-1,6-glucosidase n=1 Tax=Clostridium oryzae TaxID=1450648 RepID=A0A1V4IJ51_9CLOT|nr:amylo-alpha-1,6-glucosidase [Clostridium oryzae]OPJ60028.1 amylo-alpha-1,6-glucosidase [Clostridium oryzae]